MAAWWSMDRAPALRVTRCRYALVQPVRRMGQRFQPYTTRTAVEAHMAGKFRKIATEEAFSIPEVAEMLREVSRAPGESLDLQLVKGIYDRQPGYGELNFLDGLLDLEKVRLNDMDQNG